MCIYREGEVVKVPVCVHVYSCVAVLAGRAGLGYRSEEDLADKAEDFPANY